MTTETIHLLSQRLYKSLSASVPLPTLSLGDPKWVCHILLERLQLPRSFYIMLDRALVSVYRPRSREEEEHFRDITSWKEKRSDLECLALIVCVMKMIYRLDDVCEL